MNARRWTGLTVFLFSTGAGFFGQAEARGTHFLVEPYTGMVFNQGFSRENVVGLESGATIAVGGKLKGFPPRFYLYFRASQLFMGEADIRVPASGALCHVRRSYTGVVGGLRVVIPLLRHLRLNLEAGGGSLFSYNRYFEDGLNVEYQEDLVVAELGAGLNWRMYRWLSLGLMYGYTFVAEEERGDLIATMLEEADQGSSLGWSRLAVTLGFHF